MQKIIDLRSDTVTKPKVGMMEAIYKASSGDHGYYEDRNTIMLEEYCADFFGKEAGLFMVSGTMSNQVALRALTQPGDEILIEKNYHIHYFESGPTVDLGKVHLNLINTPDGILRISDLEWAAVNKHRSSMSNHPRLICVENTINACSGKVFPFHELSNVFRYSRENNLAIHLDGARLLNACVATGVLPHEYAAQVDTLTVCFSKGLGAPFGSILLGSRDFIDQAARYRKWYGGGLHQSGYMAAAAFYAIQHNISFLAEDHKKAALIRDLLLDCPFIALDPESIETNIVMFGIKALKMTAVEFAEIAKKRGLLVYPWSQYVIRLVTHYDVTEEEICTAIDIIKEIAEHYILNLDEAA